MQSKPEQAVWRDRLKPVLDSTVGLIYERIELRTGRAGIPDVMYSCNGTGWIELKAAELDSTGRNIDLSGWTTEQRSFARRHHTKGAKVWLLIGSRAGTVWLIDAPMVVDMQFVNKDDCSVRATWQGAPDRHELRAWLACPPLERHDLWLKLLNFVPMGGTGGRPASN